MIRFCSLMLLVFIIIVSCSEQDLPEQEYEELIFNVDSTLLGKKVSVNSAGIEFYAPRGFEQMDPEIFQNLKRSMLNLKGFNHFPMLAAVNGSQKGIFLFLKLFPEDSLIKHIAFDKIEKVLQPKDTSVKVNKIIFKKDSIDFLQYIVDVGNILDLKLFFHDKDSNLYEIDYIFITKDEYRNYSRAIESSIGSLKIH
jgi:hypothetical protein